MARRRRAADGAGSTTQTRPAPSTLSPEEQRALCRESALRLLSAADRPAAGLRARLQQKGFSAWIVAEVVERLRETGLIDDDRFARQYVEGAAARGMAPRRIRLELGRRGVESEPAVQASTASPEEEEARAFGLAERRVRQMSGLPALTVARRVTGVLSRRGFSPDLCKRAVEHALRSTFD